MRKKQGLHELGQRWEWGRSMNIFRSLGEIFFSGVQTEVRQRFEVKRESFHTEMDPDCSSLI